MSGLHGGNGVSPKTFHGIIQERMAEKKEATEQIRLRDLKRIQEMKSGVGKNPLEVFPKKVWELIFDELNPQDRRNLFGLHEVFRAIMENSHIRDSLFPLIVQFESEESQSDDGLDFLGPLPPKKRPLAHFLKLREVSKSLRKAVDGFIEEDLLKVMRQGYSSNEPRKTFHLEFEDLSTFDGDFDKLDQLVEFTEANSTMLKHFPPRSLTIELCIQDDHRDFAAQFESLKNKISRFLNHAGYQIWHFSFDASRIARSGKNRLHDLYLALMEWLLLMPHLKWLQLKFYFSKDLDSLVDMKTLRSYQVPKLQDLERLDLTVEDESMFKVELESFCKAMIAANPNVNSLHLEGVNNVLPSGRSLQLEALSVGYSANIFTRNNIYNFGWTLKQLNLSVDLKNGSIFPVFRFLEKFSSLEKLSLRLEKVTIGGGLSFLKLPKLEDFDFCIAAPIIHYDQPIHFFFSFQFLLYSKNLKKLKWGLTQTGEINRIKKYLGRNKKPGMIEFQGGLVDLTNFNLWKVFPYLENVEVNTRVDINAVRKLKVRFRGYHKRELLSTYVLSFPMP